MGFLADLGAGLQRGALAGAGALSQDVYREQSHQRVAQANEVRAQKQAVAQHILQAVHNGQVDDAHLPELQQQLVKMGYNIPLQAFGPSIEAKHSLAKYANEIAKQKRADDAAKQLLDFKFSGQGGLAPAGTPGLGLSGKTGLAQLDSLMPKDQNYGVFNPRGRVPNAADMSNDEREQMALSGMDFDQIAQVDQIDESSIDDNPDYQPQPEPRDPSAPPIWVKDGEVGVLPPVTVTGIRQRPSEPVSQVRPQQSVATPGINPTAAQVNIQPGATDLDELYRRALYAAQNGVPGGKEMLEYVIKQREAQTTPSVIEVNGSLVDKRTGRVVYQGQPKSAASSGLGKLIAERNALAAANPNDPLLAKYDESIDNFKTGITIENYGSPTQGIGPDGKPVFFQPSNKGGEPNIIEGVVPQPKEPKPLTESQAKATSFGMRAQSAHDTATQIEKSSQEVGSLQQAGKDALPLVGNYLTSSEMQRYNQAKKEFINAAVLRQDSGAAISASEYDKYNKIYFPQPGDSKETIAQKAASRETAVQGLAVGAGESGQKAQLRVQTPNTAFQRKPPPPPGIVKGFDISSTIAEANRAIRAGANPEFVKKKLLKNGFPKSIIDNHIDSQ